MPVFFKTRRVAHQFHQPQQGYVLLTLLLVVAMLGITAAIAVPTIAFEIRRDREQEMIHRGVQYSRAIRSYYKKFGRYPTRLEDLDNTNNLRYLRKHYKDPLTGQDFKLLHYGEPGVTVGGAIGGGSIPGANPIGAGGGLNSPSGLSQPSSAFGGNSSAFSQSSTFGGNSQSSAFGGSSQSSAFGVNSNSAFGSNSNSATGVGPNSTTGTQPSQNSTAPGSDDSNSGKTGSASSGDQSSSSQLVASGPIVGVASVSKKTTIREYNKKKKYNEWQFVYDPIADRGGLITTPYQPSLQGFTNPGLQPGQGTQPGNSSNSPFGQSSGFGNQTSPFGNQSAPYGPSSNAPAAVPPASNPPQQQ